MLARLGSAIDNPPDGGAEEHTRELERAVSALTSKEAALFLPSGTMCNEIAIKVHIDPGDEVIAHWSSHIIGYESGGPAALAGAMVHPLGGDHGRFTGEQVARAIRPKSRYMPPSRLVSIEQTANLAGGALWPLEVIDEVAEVAHSAGLLTHMDGARLLNAAVATGIPAARHAEGMDRVWNFLTKGRGAGVGAVMACSLKFIERAWRWKQQGGGRCASPESSPQWASTHSTIMWTGWPMTMPGQPASGRPWPGWPGWRASCRWRRTS